MITVSEFERRLVRKFGCDILKNIKSNKRLHFFVCLRVIYYYICIENGMNKSDAINKIGRDRTTAYHYDGKFNDEYKYNAYFKGIADELLKE